MSSTYQIANWNEIYENSRSRQIKDLDWVAVPNSHDGEGFSLVMIHEEGAKIFTAWVLILQVASKCPTRGVLVRENGKPHTAESLAIKTRGNVEWFRLALEFLSSEEIGWIDIEPETEVFSPGRQEGDGHPSPSRQEGDIEENRKEGIEGKGLNRMEGYAGGADRPTDLSCRVTSHLLEIPACRRCVAVGNEVAVLEKHVAEFIGDHLEYPPEWWLDWAKRLKSDLPARRARFYGNNSTNAATPYKVLDEEWGRRPPIAEKPIVDESLEDATKRRYAEALK